MFHVIIAELLVIEFDDILVAVSQTAATSSSLLQEKIIHAKANNKYVFLTLDVIF